MAHYDDVIMPNAVRFGSTTTPLTSTQQVFTAGGHRSVNQLWSQKLHRLQLRYLRRGEDLYEILKIWQALEGPVHSCLVRDWLDWNSTDGAFEPGDEAKVTAFDQPLRNSTDQSFAGDGITTDFQTVKRYGMGASALHSRRITKPQSGTIRIAVDGVEKSEGADFSVDYGSGTVTFATAPGTGQSPSAVAVTWGGAFYIPAHFVDDGTFVESLRSARVNELPSLEMLEVRL